MKHKEREEEKLSKSEVPAKDHFNTPVKNSGLLESCELQLADKSKLHTPAPCRTGIPNSLISFSPPGGFLHSIHSPFKNSKCSVFQNIGNTPHQLRDAHLIKSN